MIHNHIRERLEKREESLSPYAMKSRCSRGRQRPEEPCPMRTAFQRDRDRIIHCKAFRRLKHKTQVFIAPQGDHYVTRLTHTLEVSQIARSISRALNLNEDLTEAISLGHDLGHTPFGHIGEEVLDQLHPGGFRHNEQSLRVVDFLEREGQGLNLTYEVREGILKHSKTGVEILGKDWELPETLEGQVVKLADIVAYVNHDLTDALRAGIITEKDLPPLVISMLGRSPSRRIDTLVCDIVDYSWGATGEEKGRKPVIGMSAPMQEATSVLREFLFQRVYNPSLAEEETERAREVIRLLYQHFLAHPDKLPAEFVPSEEEVERRVVDYIAGMTDHYARRLAETLFPGGRWLIPGIPGANLGRGQ